MSKLARWLRRELERRGLSQHRGALVAGVAQGTMSDILNRGHVPKVETLFRLADSFETSRLTVLHLAGHLDLEPGPQEGGQLPAGDPLVQELVEEFRKVPDEWKEVVVEHVSHMARMANRPAVHIIGGEEAEGEPERQREDEGQSSQAA